MILITPLPGVTTTKPGSATKPFPGVEAAVLNEQGERVEQGGGYLVLERPWPAMTRGIFGDDQRFRDTYWTRFPGHYFAGDGARIDADGDFWLLGRVDDVMNVSGHRLSTIEVESALVDHPRVAEAAVCGRTDATTGQAIVAYVTLKGNEGPSVEMLEELRNHVAHKIGAIAKPANIVFTPELPKTRSGKIMRRLLRDVAENRALGDTTTLADPSVVNELATRAAEDAETASASAAARPRRDGTAGYAGSRSRSNRSASSNGPITASFSCLPTTSCATRWTSSAVTASSPASIASGSSAWPSSTSRRSPYMIVPCGLSIPSTKRPFAKARAFSSSAAGTGSSAILRSSAAIVDTASSIRWMSTPAWAYSEPASRKRGVAAEHVVGEAAPLAHLGEEARRHAAAEHRRQQLQHVPVGVPERVAARAEDDVRLVGLLREHRHRRAVRGSDGRLRQPGLARLDRAEQLLEPLRQAVADPAADADHHALGPVPAVDERREGVARGGAHGLLRADDVAAERMVAVEEVRRRRRRRSRAACRSTCSSPRR